MISILKYFLRKLAALSISFLAITAIIFSSLLLFTPKERASLYLSPNTRNPAAVERMIAQVIETHHFDDPFDLQYGRWLLNLFRGDWGYSPVYDGNVFDVILRYGPASIELLVYSLVFFIPLGILAGVAAGRRKEGILDLSIRSVAFVANSLPLFILAFILLAVFYIALGWFAPNRLSILNALYIKTQAFYLYTGFMTIDGFLNKRPDISLDALRHLVLPAFSLSILQWATLTRITRAAVIDEEKKDYVNAALARGLPGSLITWRHIFRNSLSPVLTASALMAATLTTELFVVELIFNYEGMSQLIGSLRGIPDMSAVLGFIVFNIFLSLGLILIFDMLKAWVDPRVREEVE